MDQAIELSHTPLDSNQLQLRGTMQGVLSQMRDFAAGVDVSQSREDRPWHIANEYERLIFTDSLKLAAHEVETYCRLVATKIEEMIDTNVTAQIAGQSLKKPEEQSKVLTESYSSAIKACAESIHHLLDNFISYLESASLLDLNSLPGRHFARIAYSMVALICMSVVASAPESKVREAIDPVDLRVAYYLPRLLELLRASGGDEIKRPAQKFQLVVKMLKIWYERTKDGRTSPIRNEISEMLDIQAQNVDDEGYRKLSVHGSTADAKPLKKKAQAAGAALPGNTPLELLSEVATKAPSAQASQAEWYNSPSAYQPYQQAYNPNEVQAQQAETAVMDSGTAPTGTGTGLIIDPALEQAMTMAFGSEGNMFGGFVDDFFGATIQPPNGAQNGNGGNWFPGAGV